MDQINYLPDYILGDIFGNLSPRMIKCCALVCKRWDNVIGTSKEIMERFKLDLYHKSDTEIQDARELQRKHQIARVREIDESLDVVGCHNLKSFSLTAWECDDTKVSVLIKTLNDFPLLKYLDLRLYCFPNDNVSDDHEKLKNNFVELTCNLKIIHLFDCCSVEKLKLIWQKADDKMKTQTVDFLKNQKNLKTLELIYGSDCELFNLPGILELKFPLKKLEIYCEDDPFQYYESLIKFLNRHKNSLTHLNLRFRTEPEFGIEFIHKFALENLVNLKHLEMGYIYDENSVYHDDKLTYNELPAATQIIRNLESLTIKARSTDMNENKRFYDMFTNLKRLELYLYTSDCNEVFECISERCINLESLTIGPLGKNCKIYFPKLKEFTVHTYSKEKHLCNFIKRHSQTLEKIVIKEGIIGFYLAANEISNCPNLNHLEIHCLSIVLSVLRVLDEISQKSTPFILKIPSSKGSFKFPDDKALWDEEVKAKLRERRNYCDVQ